MTFVQWPYFILSFLSPVVIASSDKTQKACNALQSIRPTQIFFPESEAYEISVSSYAYAEMRLRPTCIARPQSAEDVSALIIELGRHKAVAFAMRSGGRNTNKGFANIEDGITIDLSAMNAVKLDDGGGSVSVGAGARWQNVYDALDPHGLSAQGGRVGDVGVGGLTTGGGIGFFSPERGSVCDSVTNFEVVLSNGTITNANSASNTDLFTALKGGSSNFGVVTRFDMKAIVQGPLWGGDVSYPYSTNADLLDTFAAYKEPEKFDPHAMAVLIFAYDTAGDVFSASTGLYHSRPDKVNGSSLEALAKIQPQLVNTIRVAPAGNFAKEATEKGDLSHFYMHWATTTFTASPSLLHHIHTFWHNASTTLHPTYSPAHLNSSLVLQSVPAAAPPSNPNSLGFSPSSHPERDLVNVLVMFSYTDASATEGLLEEIKKVIWGIDRIARREGGGSEYVYMNYAGSWQDVFAGYGRGSMEEMRRVARKYDAVGMFQEQVKGGFKLFG